MPGRFLRLLNADFQFRLPHFDAVAVFECDLGVAPLGALLGSLALFPRPEFRSIEMRAVQTAEIAQARRRGIDLKDEVVAGNLRVVPDTGMAVVHASEDEGIVIEKGEGFSLDDLELDFGTHGFGMALRRTGKIVNLPKAKAWRELALMSDTLQSAGGGRAQSRAPDRSTEVS